MKRFSDLEHESRFEAVLSSVNTEFKSTTLGFCLDDSWKSASDLKDSYQTFIEDSELIIPFRPTFSAYCHRTFLPIGLVVEERVKRTEPFRYVKSWRLTEDGSMYGQYSAALAIKTANDIDMSLFPILGTTISTGDSKSPYNRAKILMHLDEKKESRVTDLSHSLKLPKGDVGKHCKNLSEISFIDYESVNTEESGWSRYAWVKGKKSENVEPVRGYVDLTPRVASFMEQNPKAWSYSELAGKIDDKYHHCISNILTGLEKQGFVKKVDKFRTTEKLSEAKITERGKNFVNEFLNPVYEALEPNVDKVILEEFEEIHHDYLDNPKLLRNHILNATELYSSVSPNLRGKPQSLTRTQIIDLVKKNGKKRYKEIKEYIGLREVSIYLRSLLERKVLKKEKDGKAVYYSLA